MKSKCIKSKCMKTISTILCVMIIFSISACNDVAKTNEEDVEELNEEQEITYPIKGNKKLTYWTPLTANSSQIVTNFGETEFAKEYQKRTGIEIEYIHPSIGQQTEQFNLLIASGDYPDIIQYDIINNYPGGPEKAIKDNFIIDLTDYISKYAPNLTKYYDENLDCKKMAKTDFDKLYSFPFIRSHEDLLTCSGIIIREDWLDDLNLKSPETIDEWYNTLKKFKIEKNSPSPFTFIYNKNVINAFAGAYSTMQDFHFDKSGNIQYGPIEKNYKNFLKEILKWYKEGLIDPDIATIDSKQRNSKITNGNSGVTFGCLCQDMGSWLKAKENDKKYSLSGTKYPVLKKGDIPNFSVKDFKLPGMASYITTGCKDIKTAVRFLDYGYSEEGHMLMNFGIEGESYELIDEEPVYTDVIMNNPERSIAVSLSNYALSGIAGPIIQDVRYFYQYALIYEQQKSALENWKISDVDNFQLPKITPKTEECNEFSTIMNEINTYVDEMFFKFLFGQEDIDQKFDEYVKNIKSMGIDRAIEIETAALKRYNAR